jgi:hypothetical protein
VRGGLGMASNNRQAVPITFCEITWNTARKATLGIITRSHISKERQHGH